MINISQLAAKVALRAGYLPARIARACALFILTDIHTVTLISTDTYVRIIVTNDPLYLFSISMTALCPIL